MDEIMDILEHQARQQARQSELMKQLASLILESQDRDKSMMTASIQLCDRIESLEAKMRGIYKVHRDINWEGH